MKEINKILYDILLKIKTDEIKFQINKDLILKYFAELKDLNNNKYKLFNDYFVRFYNYCFELSPENMIKDDLNFKL